MTKAEAQNNNVLPHDLILEGREADRDRRAADAAV